MMTTAENEPPKGTEREATLTPKAPIKKPAAKKAPIKKAPVAAKEAPKKAEEATHLAQDDYEAQMQELVDQARANGLNTLRAMTQVFAKKGLSTVNGFFASLENASSPTPTKKTKR